MEFSSVSDPRLFTSGVSLSGSLKSTVRVHVSGGWVSDVLSAFKRIWFFAEPLEMDRGANLSWRCHTGGSAARSGGANRRGVGMGWGGGGGWTAPPNHCSQSSDSFRCQSVRKKMQLDSPYFQGWRMVGISHLTCTTWRITRRLQLQRAA